MLAANRHIVCQCALDACGESKVGQVKAAVGLVERMHRARHGCERQRPIDRAICRPCLICHLSGTLAPRRARVWNKVAHWHTQGKPESRERSRSGTGYQSGDERPGTFARSARAGRHRQLVKQQLVAQGLDCNPVAWALDCQPRKLRQWSYRDVTRKVHCAIVARHRQRLIASGLRQVAVGRQAQT